MHRLRAIERNFGAGGGMVHSLGERTLRLLSLGSPISVSFVIGDQDEVTLLPALREALAEDGDFEAAWQAMTAGTRRVFAHRIGSAKGHDTIGRRVEEVRDLVMAGLTYSDVLKGARGR